MRKLWDTYFEDMSKDFGMIHDTSSTTQLQCTLKSVNYCLESMVKSINKYDLPCIDHQLPEVILSKCREVVKEMSVQIPTEDLEAQSKLNPEQEQTFKTILHSDDCGRDRLLSVDGPRGTGKIYLYRALLENVRSRGIIALATTTNGISALILLGGHTTHSRFDIPLQTNETT